MKAIFLDRDGTIIIDKHYLHQVEEVEFLNGAVEALKLFDANGYFLFLVTNQSGVGRDYFKIDSVHNVHDYINSVLIENDLPKFKDIKICPHTPSDLCRCRKPSPEMILELIHQYNIDPKQSYMFGDKQSDVDSGIASNLKGSFLIDEDNSLLEFAIQITNQKE